jgi:hypothetical protein
MLSVIHNESSHCDSPYTAGESMITYFNYHRNFQSTISITTRYIFF